MPLPAPGPPRTKTISYLLLGREGGRGKGRRERNDPARWIAAITPLLLHKHTHKDAPYPHTHTQKQCKHTHSICRVHLVLCCILASPKTTARLLFQPSVPHPHTSSFPPLPGLCYTYRDFSAFFFFLLRYNAAAAPTITNAAAAARTGNCFLERLEEEGMTTLAATTPPSLYPVPVLV